MDPTEAMAAIGEKAEYEENLDYLVVETLKSSKWRIEQMGRHIDRILPKVEAFDALLVIMRGGDRYGNSGLMAADRQGDTYEIDRTLEKIDAHMKAFAAQQREETIRAHYENLATDGAAEDFPSNFYEGVEAEDFPTVPNGYVVMSKAKAEEIQRRLDRLYEIENPTDKPVTASADLAFEAAPSFELWSPPVIDRGDGDDNA